MRGIPQCGTLVEARGRKWLLARSQSWEQCTVWSLEGRDRDNASERISLIEPFDRLKPLRPDRPRRRRRRTVLRHALACVYAARPVGGLWVAVDAAIDVLPFQLEPALAAINGATRLMLADEVGLGKTIQAGLLVAELWHRGWIERALIICPAGLRDGWRRELSDRFFLEAAILDPQAIAARVSQCPPGVNPWSSAGITIVSIDFIKREEVLAALEGVPIDLLIADEAHHLSPGTDRGTAVSGLAARAAWCVTISATPHSGDRPAFAFLTAIGAHGDPLVMFRRSRGDVGLTHSRKAHLLRVRGTTEEHRLFDAVDRYARAIWFARGRHDPAARLVAITLARRAASSAAAIQRTLARRLALLDRSPVEASQPPLPWDDADDGDDIDPDSMLAAPGLDDARAECDALRGLIDCSQSCVVDSKVRRLLRLLARIDEPVIIFTEYRDTLEMIHGRLAGLRRVEAIHGGLTTDRRRAVVDAFNGGGCDVLIATDAAGEGLNLHQRCRLVIDFELPWNPLRLEQRIGRVDRLGQARGVHAIRLFHAGSIEAQVLDRLSLRRDRAAADLNRAVSELDVAAAIFEHAGIVSVEVPEMRDGSLTRDRANREAARVSRLRRVRQPRPGARWSGTRRPLARFAFVHRLTFVSEHGTIVGEDLHAHEAALEPPAVETIVQHSTRIVELAASTTSCLEHAARLGEATAPLRRRIASIRRRIAAAQRREYQRSLFDGRADAVQEERERAAARVDESLARIERAVEGPSPAHTRIELVAVWPKDRG